jgi:hypothetical protein
VKRIKGGYHASGRLEATLDEIAMEAVTTIAEPPSVERWRRAFEEIARLAGDAKGLIAHLNSGQPPMALAGA